MADILYTAMQGENGEQFAQILDLYIPKGSRVADVTYNKGKFWKFVDRSDWELLASDLEPLEDWITQADLQDLPYDDDSLDAVILDPPYAHSSTAPMKDSIASMYNNNSVTEGSKQVHDLYLNGMVEARRVLKRGGVLVVKCQDEIESGKQRWNHVRILHQAQDLGYYAKDLLVLVQKGKPPQRHPYQKHFRKNHSFWWVFILKDRDGRVPAKPMDHPKVTLAQFQSNDGGLVS